MYYPYDDIEPMTAEEQAADVAGEYAHGMALYPRDKPREDDGPAVYLGYFYAKDHGRPMTPEEIRKASEAFYQEELAEIEKLADVECD